MNLKNEIKKEYEDSLPVSSDMSFISSDVTLTKSKRNIKLPLIISLASVVVIGGSVGVSLSLTSSGLSSILLNNNNYSFNQTVTSIDLDEISLNNIATFSLDLLAPYLNEEEGNQVVSPASLAIAVGAQLAVSSDIEEFASNMGYTASAVKEELVALLDGLNWSDEEHDSLSYLKSLAVIQQVGDKYKIDKTKIKDFDDVNIMFAKSSYEDAHQDLQTIYEELIGLTIDVPAYPEYLTNAIVLAGALVLKDSFSQELTSFTSTFYLNDNETVECEFSSLDGYYYYYKGENYAALLRNIRKTKLLFILPDEGYELTDIDLTDVYQDFYENRDYYFVQGKIPFFSVESSFDITDSLLEQITGNPILCDKILADDVERELSVLSASQNSKFEFDRTGVKGESVTVIVGSESAMPDTEDPITFDCDRPFYALSIYDDFPLFAMKIENPTL